MRILSYNRTDQLEPWDSVRSGGVDITLMQGEHRGHGRRTEDEDPEHPFERYENCLIPTSGRVSVERINAFCAMVSHDHQRILVMSMFFKRGRSQFYPAFASQWCTYRYDRQIREYLTIDKGLSVIAAGSVEDPKVHPKDVFDRMRSIGLVPIDEHCYAFVTESLVPFVQVHRTACGIVIDTVR